MKRSSSFANSRSVPAKTNGNCNANASALYASARCLDITLTTVTEQASTKEWKREEREHYDPLNLTDLSKSSIESSWDE